MLRPVLLRIGYALQQVGPVLVVIGKAAHGTVNHTYGPQRFLRAGEPQTVDGIRGPVSRPFSQAVVEVGAAEHAG